jgi:hypothetical protein
MRERDVEQRSRMDGADGGVRHRHQIVTTGRDVSGGHREVL